jgi:PadR family transcriptional regulator PadR
MVRMTPQTQAVLAAFLEDPALPHYGLELCHAAGGASGTIYPILARLEAAGWVESNWEDIDPSAEGRRPRRYYRLTGEGEKEARAAFAETVRKLEGVLARPRPRTA